ncbi:MAG: amidohydrolase, partial [Sphaerochaetaceae bacterium]
MKTLIKNVTIAPMSAEGELLKGSILIEEGKIKGLGQIPDTPVDRIIDGYNHVALPGLFNAHTHLSMVYFRNYGTAH